MMLPSSSYPPDVRRLHEGGVRLLSAKVVEQCRAGACVTLGAAGAPLTAPAEQQGGSPLDPATVGGGVAGGLVTIIAVVAGFVAQRFNAISRAVAGPGPGPGPGSGKQGEDQTKRAL